MITLDVFANILFLSLPIVISGILHMVVVRRSLWMSLNVPFSLTLFGANKTWRGLISMLVFTIYGVYVCVGFQRLFRLDFTYAFSLDTGYIIGAFLGLFYILGELPNSFVKRRIGIPPGHSGQPRWLFCLFDLFDSVGAITLVYVYWFGFSWREGIVTLLSFPVVFIGFKWIIVQLKVKKNI